MRKNYMSVMLSGWTEWQFNKNWEPTTQNHLISSRPLASSVTTRGDVVCSAIGWLPTSWRA